MASTLAENPRPDAAKPGEMVGIRNVGQERWHLGIIHWIQINEHNWEMGIELLSPNPEPYALKVVKSKQDTDFLRAILIPPVGNTGENFTILMPNIGVSGKTAAILVNEYTKDRVILRERVREIGEFSQHSLAKQQGTPATQRE
ncbi:hypothetical protein GYB62_00035 [bacterium]|nr:hypothetical protein [bacterium]